MALFGQAAGSTTGNVGEEASYDECANVRVQFHNQVDRRGINKWWKEQMRTHCESQDLYSILIGEEGGALTCCVNDPKHVSVHDGQLV